jgi:hypothetical protein
MKESQEEEGVYACFHGRDCKQGERGKQEADREQLLRLNVAISQSAEKEHGYDRRDTLRPVCEANYMVEAQVFAHVASERHEPRAHHRILQEHQKTEPNPEHPVHPSLSQSHIT